MFLQKLTVVAAFAIVSIQADQTWYNLKTTWGPTPLNGFYDQPRTVEEANYAGWVQVSNDCAEGASIPGNLMAPPEADPEMVLIFDVNGFIAGMHSVVAKKFVSAGFDFGASKWYRSVDALDAFVTTAYFVDPAIICQGGRSQAEFDMEGTGNRVWFQNGPTTADVLNTPLTLDEADADAYWYKHYCFLNMGRHYFNLNYDVNGSCDDLTPIQLIYSGGVLNGIVWQHPAAMPQARWESVNSFGLSQIVDRPPQCLYDLVESPGVRTMHTYFRNYGTLCIDDRNQ